MDASSPHDPSRLDGRWALITGGGRGIGRAIAFELAKRGANMILTYKSDSEAAEQTADELRAQGSEVWVTSVDVRKTPDIERMAQEVAERQPELHMLVLNAAFGTIDDVFNVGRASWKATFDTNVVGNWYVAKNILPQLKETGGCIVALSSIGGIMPFPQYAPLGSSKASLEALVRQMAIEWGRYGIRCNGVSGGPVDTRALDWFRHPTATRLFAKEKSVFKRMSVAEDLAPVVAFLCTDDARWITGQTIVADGGMTCGMDWTEFHRDEKGAPTW